MRAILEHDRAALLQGDAADLGQILDEYTIDALVTDPPAGIGFMGKEWDGDKGGRDQWVQWLAQTLAPAFRALKPGAHGLVWAIPRTSHWTALALELAGFEIRDRVSHLFGTGFPKSLNLGDGRGTALKPAVEDWWLVRKPLQGTIAGNVEQWGTGVLNIDACRIGDEPLKQHGRSGDSFGFTSAEPAGRAWSGRWPAHLVLDEAAAAILDEQSGVSKSGTAVRRNKGIVASKNVRYSGDGPTSLNDVTFGGASRFFYVAKPSRSERDAGCAHLPKRSAGEATDREDGSAGLNNPRAGAGRTGGARNFHPTVKSIALMRWLVRLITPVGGVVLDPFAGSGSTGVAALAEGRGFIGVERDDEYIPITCARLEHALGLGAEQDDEGEAA